MRKSFIVATLAGATSVFYRSFIKEQDGAQFGKNVIKTAGFILLLGILGLFSPLQTITDVIGYMFAVIVLLNDGYDIIKAVGSI